MRVNQHDINGLNEISRPVRPFGTVQPFIDTEIQLLEARKENVEIQDEGKASLHCMEYPLLENKTDHM